MDTETSTESVTVDVERVEPTKKRRGKGRKPVIDEVTKRVEKNKKQQERTSLD